MGNSSAKRFLAAIQNPEDAEKTQKAFQAADKNSSGKLDSTEWRAFCRVLLEQDIEVIKAKAMEVATQLSHHLDEHDQNRVKGEMIRAFNYAIADCIPDTDSFINLLFQDVDLDHGGVSYEEFINFLTLHHVNMEASLGFSLFGPTEHLYWKRHVGFRMMENPVLPMLGTDEHSQPFSYPTLEEAQEAALFILPFCSGIMRDGKEFRLCGEYKLEETAGPEDVCWKLELKDEYKIEWTFYEHKVAQIDTYSPAPSGYRRRRFHSLKAAQEAAESLGHMCGSIVNLPGCGWELRVASKVREIGYDFPGGAPTDGCWVKTPVLR